MEKVGYIYVLTNESFHKDNWIKIGYSIDVEKRVKELSGTAVPLPYEIYCTYEIPRIDKGKEADKLLHNLIMKLNPELRISSNREFFEMYPWDAYEMLLLIAKMHNREDKLKRNDKNNSGEELSKEYSADLLFSEKKNNTKLYETIREIVLSLDSSLREVPTANYVVFKKDNRNTVSLWPRNGWIEVVLNAKLGQIKDDTGLVYDISNRQWSSEQYALKFNDTTDVEVVKGILKQAIDLKK